MSIEQRIMNIENHALHRITGVLEILCHFFKLAIKRNDTCLKNLILIKRWTPCEVVRT